MTRRMNTAFHFRLGFMVRKLCARSGRGRSYFASSDASTCAIAERAMRIFTWSDLEDDRLAVNSIDGSVDPAVRDDFVAGFERRYHCLHLFALPLLRQYEHHVEDGHHHDHHD